jgi:hypothetical protein
VTLVPEVDGYGRFPPGGGHVPPTCYVPGTQQGAAGPGLAGSYFFPAGYNSNQALRAPVTSSTTGQGVGVTVMCMPGRQYTAQMQVSQTVANTTAVTIDGATVGTAVTIPVAWTLLTLTFTASQPYHVLAAETSGQALPGAVSVDNIQLEPGGVVTAFSSSGPVIYPLMRNYVERWPRLWSAAGFEGFTQAPCVDGFAALNAITIASEAREAILATSPDYYWPLSDGAAPFVDISGNGGPPLTPVASIHGPGTGVSVPGTATGLVGDPGGVGEELTVQTGQDGLGYALVPTVPVSVNLGGNSASWATTVGCWFSTTIGDGTTTNYLVSLFGSRLDIAPSTVSPLPALQMLGGSNTGSNPWMSTFNGNSLPPGGNVNLNGTATGNLNNGTPHLYVGVFTLSSNTYTQTMYIDGVQVATGSVNATTTFGSATPDLTTTTLQVCGEVDAYINGPGQAGIYSHLAAWRRALSATEISDLYNAGGLGYAGETSGARISRHLSRGGYVGSTRISTGQTTMQPPSFVGDITLLVDCQATTLAEQGTIWVAPDGAVVFEDRNTRWARLTSAFTLGENVPAEIPYQGDVEFDYDPNFVAPEVKVTRPGGATTSGGTTAQVTAASKRYFPRAYDASVDVATDAQAQDLANWVFATHRAPLLRVASITIDPASNPDLWPAALSLEVGMRVTVVRRPKAANAGAGIVMSGPYYVEQVIHNDIDFTAGTWTVTLYLSPIGSATAGSGVTFQPWILGDATYGVLGSTTLLGF